MWALCPHLLPGRIGKLLRVAERFCSAGEPINWLGVSTRILISTLLPARYYLAGKKMKVDLSILCNFLHIWSSWQKKKPSKQGKILKVDVCISRNFLHFWSSLQKMLPPNRGENCEGGCMNFMQFPMFLV